MRTNSKEGVLFYVSGQNNKEFLALEVWKGKPRLIAANQVIFHRIISLGFLVLVDDFTPSGCNFSSDRCSNFYRLCISFEACSSLRVGVFDIGEKKTC